MKTYTFEIPVSQEGNGKKVVRSIEMILQDGGFVTNRQQYVRGKNTVEEFTVECNSDTEFADLLISVGQSTIKDFSN